jgi:hypothetical protein
MVAWILLAAVTAAVGSLCAVRIARVRELSHPTVPDAARLGEELLAFVERESRAEPGRVVELRPFWEGRMLTEADRYAIQGPLLLSGRLLAADEETTFLGRLKAYATAPLAERVVLSRGS